MNSKNRLNSEEELWNAHLGASLSQCLDCASVPERWKAVRCDETRQLRVQRES